MRHLGADVGLGDVAARVLQLALEDDLEIGPGALLPVDALEGGDGRIVGLLEIVEDAPEGDDGLVEVDEALLVDLTEAPVELDELERLRRREDALLERARELGVLLLRRVDAVEVAERLGVERLDAEHVLVGLLGLLDVAQLILEDAREALADGGLHRLVGVYAEHVGVRVGEQLPAAVRRAGEPLHLLERLLVGRVLLERAKVGVERTVEGDEALLVELADAVVHGQARTGLGDVSQLGLEHAGELVPLARRLVERLEDLADLHLVDAGGEEPLQRLARGRVLGRRRQDLLVGCDRRGEIVEPRLVDLPEAILELEDLVGALPDLGSHA